MKKRLLATLLIIFAITGYTNDREREQLAHILAELDRVAYMSMRAHQSQEDNARSYFDFEQLRFDIGQLKRGIHAYLAAMPMQAHLIKPLDNDYLERRGLE